MCGLGPRANDAAGEYFTIAEQDAQFDGVIHGTGRRMEIGSSQAEACECDRGLRAVVLRAGR
jgi:hypothetical protein